MTDLPERTSYRAEQPLALVIGCGDMGMGCARSLGRRDPLLVVDIDAARLAGAVNALRGEGYMASGQVCDITNPGQVAELSQTLARGPGVRVLAHVAAVGASPLGWREVIRVDLIGAHLIAGAVAPHMVRGGVAILVSSTGSYFCPQDPRLLSLLDEPFAPDFHDRLIQALGGEPDMLDAYFIAKQGVNRLAERLAIDWGENEVRALSISPGLIDSSMGRSSGAALPVYDGSGSETRLGSRAEKAQREVPLGRQGSVLEITGVVEFLASDGASFINGIDIPIDGGARALRRKRQAIET